MEKAEKWIFEAHGLVAKAFEHAREREGVPTCFKRKREEERATCALMRRGGPCLTLSSLREGISPSAHGLRLLWPPLICYACMHAHMHSLLTFPVGYKWYVCMPL